MLIVFTNTYDFFNNYYFTIFWERSPGALDTYRFGRGRVKIMAIHSWTEERRRANQRKSSLSPLPTTVAASHDCGRNGHSHGLNSAAGIQFKQAFKRRDFDRKLVAIMPVVVFCLHTKQTRSNPIDSCCLDDDYKQCRRGRWWTHNVSNVHIHCTT